MNSRGLTIAAILLAGLGGVLWWSNKDKAKETDKPSPDAPPKILTLTDADIRKLELKKIGGDPLVLEKNVSGKWAIVAPQAFGADQDAMTGLVSAASSVTSDRLVDEKPADLKEYGLTSPPFELDITLKSGKTSKLFLGDDAPVGGSTYAKLDGDPRVFTVASFTKTALMKELKDLRDKRILTFDQDKLSRVELLAKQQNIEFGRDKDHWQILKPKPLRADGLQVEELVRKLKDAKMDLTTTVDNTASFASGTPVATVKVTDASGTQELQIRKKGDDFFAKSSAVEGVHKVAADLGTGVDKSLDDFRNKKLFDFGFNEPDKIEMHAGGKTFAFQKSRDKANDKWMSGGKEMDSTSIQSFLDKLRDLSAAKFVDTGFTTATVDVSVTLGKNVEKVLFSKTADGYVAQRENEPSLYALDAKTLDDLTRAAGDVKPAASKK